MYQRKLQCNINDYFTFNDYKRLVMLDEMCTAKNWRSKVSDSCDAKISVEKYWLQCTVDQLNYIGCIIKAHALSAMGKDQAAAGCQALCLTKAVTFLYTQPVGYVKNWKKNLNK